MICDTCGREIDVEKFGLHDGQSCKRIGEQLPEEVHRVRAENANLNLQNDELKKALDRDKTGLAAALAAIREEVKGRRWICEGRGPYTYDDDRYRQETGFALDAIEKLAAEALAASGKLAHETLVVKRKEEA